MHRAYSVLHLKAVDDDQRVITGMATTPNPDRVDDVVESLGVEFKNPVPLLLYHDSRQPVGTARFSRPTKDGVEFTAKIASVAEPGKLKDRVDEAWQSIKANLLRGVSIGFRAKEMAFLETGGIHFLKTEVFELSLVSIPANAEATIATIKSLDTDAPAVVGTPADVRSQTTPAVVGTVRVVKSTRQGQSMKKSYADQIKEFEATRQSKTARMDEIMEKAADEGRTLEATEQDEYDGLEKDVKATDEHLVRLRAAEERSKFTAKAVVATDPVTAAQSRSHSTVISVGGDNRDKGIGFARAIMAKMASFVEMRQGNFLSAVDIAKNWWPSDQGVHRHLEESMRLKTAVNAATTQASTYAGVLVYADNLTSEFIEFLRPMTIIGKFGLPSPTQ